MTSTGSSTHTSGTQVSFIGIDIINSPMVLVCCGQTSKDTAIANMNASVEEWRGTSGKLKMS
jgi:hypothetical protein